MHARTHTHTYKHIHNR